MSTSARRLRIATAWYDKRTRTWKPGKVITAHAATFSAGRLRSFAKIALSKKGKWRVVAIHTVNGISAMSKATYVVVR